MQPRKGATLLEVLVAIFIMGIGLIALLVLFPLGALSMARAIQNERAAQAAVSANAIANVAGIRQDPGIAPYFIYQPLAGPTGDHYLNPVPGVLANAHPEGKSYPLFIDSVGFFTAAGLGSQTSVGNPGTFLLARRSVSFIGAPADVYRWFTFLDDITFDKDGLAQTVPNLPNPPIMERDIRYSCAFLCQRPRTADVSIVDCQVVIFNSRPLGLTGNLDLSEYPYYLYDAGTNTAEVTFYPTQNGIRIWYGPPFTGMPYNKAGVVPPIRAGDWVLDVSTPIINGRIDPHGTFYRVAGVSDSGTYLDIETQQPIRGFPPGVNTVDSRPGQNARLLFLEGVAEVFDRGVGKNP
jgi:hypothetical protein